ncbi:MAG: redoxin domain-containing protein [Pirellulaceae bacterium]
MFILCKTFARATSISFARFVLAVVLAGCYLNWAKYCRAQLDSADNNPQYQFRLTSIDGDLINVSTQNETRVWVVCFLGTECPMARQYAGRLSQMSQELSDQGVRFVGIDSNSQDSLDDLKNYATELGVSFPLAKDYDHQIADRYQASRTPEVYVLDHDLALRYHGAIDDQYQPGVARASVGSHFLEDAIQLILNGDSVQTPFVEATGCIIGRVKTENPDASVTFTRDVAPILNRHCVECHRAGEIGPFELISYESARGWAEMMLEVVENQRMPPWHADPNVGEFSNARHMPAEDKQLLRQWVEQGAAYGASDELPDPPSFTAGWRLPQKPDAVIAMSATPFNVPANGTVEYQYFVVDPGFTEDKWVTSAEVVPGDASVVHHSIVFVRPPDGESFQGIGWLGAYVPGQGAPAFDSKRARRIPAGSKLVFQQHYTPVGEIRSDTTRVGLVFGNEEDVKEELVTLIGLNQSFEIPPHANQHAVRGSINWKPDRGYLLSVAPHMHYRGKAFELLGVSEGRSNSMLRVPAYDFNWQHVYRFAEPVALETINDLQFEVQFDNSDKNPFNPNPNELVTWGDQTWEEMAVAFFEVALPRDTSGSLESSPDAAFNFGTPGEEIKQKTESVDDKVKRFFSDFDRNGDSIVSENETPAAFRHFGFFKFDDNEDGKLTAEEIRPYFESRRK